jgi:hypothetical protein
MRTLVQSCLLCFALAAWSAPAEADVVLFDSGAPDGKMATASRPDAGGKIEIESADDFIANSPFKINSATFTGLITGATPTIGQVTVEMYRVFPLDSTIPPSGNVLTRTNSPSDIAFATRDSTANTLTFSTATLSTTFTAGNSVLNGINKFPNQTTGGEGGVTGTEVQFTVNFSTPFSLPADHYFFVPQVQVTGGEFYWLSAPRPVPGQFALNPDLQSWIRNENLDPDWSRVGTDIVGGTNPPTFNASFSLVGTAVPEPSPMILAALGVLVGLAASGHRARRVRA